MNTGKIVISLVFIVLLITIGGYFAKVESNGNYELELVATENGWGYTVYLDQKLIIKQLSIPGLQGRTPFKTKADAKKIGSLVIKKLNDGVMPVISKNELYQHQIKIY